MHAVNFRIYLDSAGNSPGNSQGTILCMWIMNATFVSCGTSLIRDILEASYWKQYTKFALDGKPV
jgi:hypothetical protein